MSVNNDHEVILKVEGGVTKEIGRERERRERERRYKLRERELKLTHLQLSATLIALIVRLPTLFLAKLQLPMASDRQRARIRGVFRWRLQPWFPPELPLSSHPFFSLPPPLHCPSSFVRGMFEEMHLTLDK